MEKKRQNKNAGFSLLEVIVAMAVLALISIPLMKYFSDSLKYSTKMQRQQQATILAQKKIEDLKAQEQPLIRIPDGETDYTVPYLVDASLGYTVTSSDLNDSATANGIGTGSISLAKTEDPYDIEITLSTDVSANDIERPVIYGIDDTTDVLAVEQTQTQEALSYFQAVNASYAAANGTAAIGADQIRKKMQREIEIGLGRNGTSDTISVSYTYSCTGLREASQTDTFTPSKLLDVRLDGLKRIYLLYDKIAETDESGFAKADTVILTKTADVPVTFSPELYLVCQNPADRNDYRVKLAGITAGQKIHTNIRMAAGGTSTGCVVDTYGNAITTEPLTDTGKPVRLISMSVSVYPKGHGSTDEPYATLQTTKGE